MSKKRRQFTKQQKADAVELVRTSGNTIAQVARDLGIVENTLRNWVNQAEIDSGERGDAGLTTDEKEELRRLKRENLRLRMERDFLKKAAAYFAQENGDSN